MKTVSVIIAVYNDEAHIEKCVLSVCRQSYPELQIIVVDDGSADSTPAILARLAAQDARVQLIRKQNGGISAARNTGLAAATGDFICWLDSDDWMEAEMIGTLVDAAERTGADMALTDYDNIAGNGARERRYALHGERIFTGEEALHALVKKEITQAVWGNIARRSLYRDVAFPEGLLFEDVRVMYRLYERCEKVVLVDQMLMNRLTLANSISHARSIAKRVESSEAYLERQQILNAAHPEWEADFVIANYGTLFLLRSAVVRASYSAFRPYRARIRRIARYFRSHGDVFPSKQAGFGARMEHYLLTGGSYAGIKLSLLVGRFAKGNSFLKALQGKRA